MPSWQCGWLCHLLPESWSFLIREKGESRDGRFACALEPERECACVRVCWKITTKPDCKQTQGVYGLSQHHDHLTVSREAEQA